MTSRIDLQASTRVVLVLCAAGAIASCSSGRMSGGEARGTAGAAGQTSPPESPEAAPATVYDDLRQYIDQNDPIAALDAGELDAAPTRDVMEAPPVYDAAPGEAGEAEQSVVEQPDPVETPVVEPEPAPEPEAVETPDERRNKLIAQLRDVIREMGTGEDRATSEAVDLLALQLLDAESCGPELRAVRKTLGPAQQRSLTILQDLLRDLREDGNGLDAGRLARVLSQHAERMADQRQVRVTTAALCTSVESFGKYTRFGSYTFLQGRAQPAIVYTALENFGEREAAGASVAGSAGAPTQWTTEFLETVTIHTEVDDLVVWRAPEARIRDVSRDRRRDYYLVQRIELPARLTLGKYTMKISVQDVVTGSTDEAIIPIEVVADPALVRAR